MPGMFGGGPPPMPGMFGGGRQDNQLVGGSDFLPKPSPPVAMTPGGMSRIGSLLSSLQGGGFGGGFQSQGPKSLRGRQMQAMGGMFGSQGRSQMAQPNVKGLASGIFSNFGDALNFFGR